MRIVAVALLVAAGGLSLAGCNVAGPGSSATAGANYAPYDQETNPYCGALGTCAPLNNAPRALRGNYSN
jgi:predicted small secreted protein